MALEEFNELEHIAGDANILNETRFMLEEGRKNLSDEDIETLKLAIDFFDRISIGLQFEDNKKYVHNLKDSLNTLKNSRITLTNIDNYLQKVENSKSLLKKILEEKKFNKNKIDNLLIIFFRKLGDALLQQSLDHKSRIL